MRIAPHPFLFRVNKRAYESASSEYGQRLLKHNLLSVYAEDPEKFKRYMVGDICNVGGIKHTDAVFGRVKDHIGISDLNISRTALTKGAELAKQIGYSGWKRVLAGLWAARIFHAAKSVYSQPSWAEKDFANGFLKKFKTSNSIEDVFEYCSKFRLEMLYRTIGNPPLRALPNPDLEALRQIAGDTYAVPDSIALQEWRLRAIINSAREEIAEKIEESKKADGTPVKPTLASTRVVNHAKRLGKKKMLLVLEEFEKTHPARQINYRVLIPAKHVMANAWHEFTGKYEPGSSSKLSF